MHNGKLAFCKITDKNRRLFGRPQKCIYYIFSSFLRFIQTFHFPDGGIVRLLLIDVEIPDYIFPAEVSRNIAPAHALLRAVLSPVARLSKIYPFATAMSLQFTSFKKTSLPPGFTISVSVPSE